MSFTDIDITELSIYCELFGYNLNMYPTHAILKKEHVCIQISMGKSCLNTPTDIHVNESSYIKDVSDHFSRRELLLMVRIQNSSLLQNIVPYKILMMYFLNGSRLMAQYIGYSYKTQISHVLKGYTRIIPDLDGNYDFDTYVHTGPEYHVILTKRIKGHFYLGYRHFHYKNCTDTRERFRQHTGGGYVIEDGNIYNEDMFNYKYGGNCFI